MRRGEGILYLGEVVHIHGHGQAAAGGSERFARLRHVPPDHQLLVPVGTLVLLQAPSESDADALAKPELCWGVR